jgi:hypothetical protein
MSTKTTFKRIALVAVAALGFGMLSVVPSTAVPQADTLTSSATTATALPGADAKVTITQTYLSTGTSDTVTATVQVVSMPTGNSVVPTLSTTLATGVTNAGSPVQSVSGLVASSGSVAANTFVRSNFQLILNSQVKGTYVFKVTPQTGSNATALTLTYTIADTAVAPTVKSSRVYMQAGAGGANKAGAVLDNGGGYAMVANSTVTNAALLTALGAHIATQDANTSNVKTYNYVGGVATTGNSVANFAVILGDGDTITASTISGASQCDTVRTGCTAGDYTPSSALYFNAAGFPVTTTVTGPGFIKYEGVVQGKTHTELSTAGLVNYLQKSYVLVSDGTTGATTVTFTSGGVTLGTFTVNFLDKLASYTVAKSTTFSTKAYAVGTNTGAITVTALDKNGLAINGATVYAYSGTAATATIAASAVTSATGVATFDLTGVAVGTTELSFGNAATLATSTVVATTSAEVTGSTATTVTFTTDKADYVPGEKVTLTITAKDANGKPVADGARALLATITSNIALGGTALSTTTTLFGGVATQTFFAPATPGEFTISGTKGAAALADPVSVKATVTNFAQDVAQAAADAAAEAIDAANAATDAANAAAEAADAATAAAQDAADAVAALSVQVTEQIAELKAQNIALRKQLIALTNLIIKIQKKVKA